MDVVHNSTLTRYLKKKKRKSTNVQYMEIAKQEKIVQTDIGQDRTLSLLQMGGLLNLEVLTK